MWETQCVVETAVTTLCTCWHTPAWIYHQSPVVGLTVGGWKILSDSPTLLRGDSANHVATVPPNDKTLDTNLSQQMQRLNYITNFNTWNSVYFQYSCMEAQLLKSGFTWSISTNNDCNKWPQPVVSHLWPVHAWPSWTQRQEAGEVSPSAAHVDL